MTESQIFELNFWLKAYTKWKMPLNMVVIKFWNIDINKELKTWKNIVVGNTWLYLNNGEVKDTYFNSNRNKPIELKDMKFIDLYWIEKDRKPLPVRRMGKEIIKLFEKEIKNYEY